MNKAASDPYADPSRLETRGGFHARYSKSNCFDWVAERMPLTAGDRLLDVGGGLGWFWEGRSGPDIEMTIIDRSPVMLEQAVRKVAVAGAYEADATSLPFEDASFDAVVAMHVLYHVLDPHIALKEIARVLRPGGNVFVTTVAEGDLAEASELSRRVFGSAAADEVQRVFGTQSALAMMNAIFANVRHHRMQETYHVDNAETLAGYVLSMPPGDQADTAMQATLAQAAVALIDAAGGTVKMRRMQDMMCAVKAL